MINVHREVFGQGQTIIMVHGWAMHSGIWRRFAEALAEHYRVICIDLPGHGQSPALTPFTLERISTILVEAAPAERCCWLGWSLGASVVLDLAARFPERADALILMAGNPSFTRSYDSPLGNSLHSGPWPGMSGHQLHAFIDRFAKDPEAALLNFLALQVHGLPEARALQKELKAAVQTRPIPDITTLRQGLSILQAADLRPVLSRLTLPVLAMLGSKDALVPVSVGIKLQALSPHLRLTVLDGAGHVPFLTHQSELVVAIDRFMDAL